MSRSIDSFRRATTTIDNERTPTNSSADPHTDLLISDEDSSNTARDNELVIHEDGDGIESERKTLSSKFHVTPAASLHVKTFISSSAAPPDEASDVSNGKPTEEFERSFLRAVDRALGMNNKDPNHLLEPVYDTPAKTEDSEMNLVQMTERALSSFNGSNFFTDAEQKHEPVTNGGESPNVELFDRTGEFFDTENVNWQSSAVYDHEQEKSHVHNNHEDHTIDNNVWSVVEDLTLKTPDLSSEEPQVSARIN